MFIALKTKIWLTVLAIVLLFTFFTLQYFPAKQGELLLKNYNSEVQNLARTVALGVKIALDEQNYQGVQTAMEFVKESPGLKFVSLIQFDTIHSPGSGDSAIKEIILMTYPDTLILDTLEAASDSVIVKRAPFNTQTLSGAVQLGFSTDEIRESQAKIRRTSLIVSGGIFGVGLLIGLWFSRNISVPVRALRDAIRRVGSGDLTAFIKKAPNDEIGELASAFNIMVQDVSKAREESNRLNQSLSETNALLNSTVQNLKSTQSQLIHSEKMASLGELTAGIAHEIQNPLNFVNNFSELNSELITELKDELAVVRQRSPTADNLQQANEIASTLKENEEKIIFHGKRADAIVKGMLQHSRASSGIKEQTDLNKLVNEYLRLAFHGHRAKDNAFNAVVKTDFDPTISKINIVPQDIGRVLLNLVTNAFHAVSGPQLLKEGAQMTPTVTVTTLKRVHLANEMESEGGMIEIRVQDNGLGIPDSIKDKIFQPFFTTKPTGQGTGLGLSLSYDIIKAHGGEITVESKEGEGTTFIVSLPV